MVRPKRSHRHHPGIRRNGCSSQPHTASALDSPPCEGDDDLQRLGVTAPVDAKKGDPPRWVPFFLNCVRRCPTLPHPVECSTIGAGGLSFRVRNGTGRFPLAMAAETLLMFQSAQQKSLSCGSRPYIENHSVDASTKNGVLSSHRLISTSQLHVLPRFHIWPINPVVCWEPLARRHGSLILRPASRLDAFSGYPSRT